MSNKVTTLGAGGIKVDTCAIPFRPSGFDSPLLYRNLFGSSAMRLSRLLKVKCRGDYLCLHAGSPGLDMAEGDVIIR